MPGIFSLPNSPVDESHDQAEHRGHDGGEQAERNRSEQVPILELVLRHLVGIQEDRCRRRRSRVPNETLEETIVLTRALVNRGPPGRAISMIIITTMTVLENNPP